MEKNVLDLQLVLVVRVASAQHAELFGEGQTLGEVFRGDEVESDLDAVENVDHLMWSSSRNENRVADVLTDRVADNQAFLQALAKSFIDVPVLWK